MYAKVPHSGKSTTNPRGRLGVHEVPSHPTILMPLYQLRQINAHTHLGIWQIQETPEKLSEALAVLAPALPVPPFASAKRQREWLASRLLAYTLLLKFTPAYHPLAYDPYGKPGFLTGPCRLSITHSGEWAAVIVSSTCEVGIDLELISSRIKDIAPKFLSSRELMGAGEDTEKLSILWSSKETLYKLYSRKKLIFKEHLQVEIGCLTTAGQVSARVVTPHFERLYNINYEKLNGYILTYCLDKAEEDNFK
jgi:4'-phosphopantetheinyl transferase